MFNGFPGNRGGGASTNQWINPGQPQQGQGQGMNVGMWDKGRMDSNNGPNHFAQQMQTYAQSRPADMNMHQWMMNRPQNPQQGMSETLPAQPPSGPPGMPPEMLAWLQSRQQGQGQGMGGQPSGPPGVASGSPFPGQMNQQWLTQLNPNGGGMLSGMNPPWDRRGGNQ